MSIGMSYDEFWNGDVTMVRAYRKAYELNRRRQNEEVWMQGLYFREALLSTVGNMFSKGGATPFEYPKEPYPVTEEQVAEKEEREHRDMEERIKRDFAALAVQMQNRKMPKEGRNDDWDIQNPK